MAVETFDLRYFEDVLGTIAAKYGMAINDSHLASNNEWQFFLLVKAFPEHRDNILMRVNSSVHGDGMSAASGEDSIRLWLVDARDEPVGSKTQRWVTRVKGWEERLEKVFEIMVTLGKEIEWCPKCNQLESFFKVKKDGPNKGRLFKKCDCDGSFRWMDVPQLGEKVEEEHMTKVEAPEPVAAPGQVICPRCGSEMVERNGMYGRFYGCSTFPQCRGTRDISEVTVVVEEEKPKSYTPSKYQQAIFNWVDDGYKAGDAGKQNLVIEALAGSGKTTTGVKILERVPGSQQVLFLAFNRSIAQELKKRAPAHVKASTLHSLGFSVLMDSFKLTIDDVNNQKIKTILKSLVDLDNNPELLSPTQQLISLAKANLMEPNEENLNQLATYYGILLNGNEALVYELVAKAMARALEMTHVIDMDDMIYMPVKLGLPVSKADFIFGDEIQDWNKANLALVKMFADGNTRFVGAGDRYQSLYGFRGADVDSIPNIIEQLGADVLPLSITYRCPRRVVELVNETHPHIPLEAADWAKDGDVKNMPEWAALNAMESGDMVLCRINAPLVSPCFDLIRRGKKAVIRGRDIGKGLVALIDKMKAANVAELMVSLASYQEAEVTKLILAKKTSAAQLLEDKVETILAVSDNCATVDNIKAKIERVFSDEVEGVVFSSVHKAKGLEADSVYILHPELMPHPKATQPWELQQESNIEYVAYTRAMDNLIFVS